MVYQMPQSEIKKLHAVYTATAEGKDAEAAMIEAAEDRGYFVTDETNTPTAEGGYVHNIRLTKIEENPKNPALVIEHCGWAHCNHPPMQHRHRRSEWYCYFL